MKSYARKVILLTKLRHDVIKERNQGYIAPAHEIFPQLLHTLLITENGGKIIPPHELMELQNVVENNIENSKGYELMPFVRESFIRLAKLIYSNENTLNSEAFKLEYTSPYLLVTNAEYELETSYNDDEKKRKYMKMIDAADTLATMHENEPEFSRVIQKRYNLF